MKVNKILKKGIIFFFTINLIIFSPCFTKNFVEAQFSYLGSSYYGLGGSSYIGRPNVYYGTTGIPGIPLGSMLSSGLYGLYGGGLYGAVSGLYGRGLGIFGGLYGTGLYGGLYGGSYGFYGAGLLGGFYGMGLYGGLLSGISGLYGGLLGSLGLAGGIYGLGGLTNPLFFAEQVGTWRGTWTNFVTSGLMTLNIAEDPITGALYGYAQLLGNFYLDAFLSISGTVLNNQIFVEGSGTGLGNQNFTCQIIGTLTSTTTMIGTYNMINNSGGGTITEQGSFNLELLPAVI